jgi:cytochrome c-type biogenesis protein CcmH
VGEAKTPKRVLIGIAIGGVIVLGFVVGYFVGTRSGGVDATRVAADLHGRPDTVEDPAAVGGPGMSGPAPSLNDLLPGLEAKVAANPRDIDQRLLLAQTYNEIGDRQKGIDALQAIHRDQPDNTRAALLLATTLMDQGSASDLRAAFALLDEAARRKPELAVMARLYQGEIRAQLGDREGAQRIWRAQLAQLPPGSPQRELYENKLAATSR